MYRFFQRTQGKTERWQPVQTSNVKDLESRGYPMMTILSVSAYGRTVEQSKIEYQGDLYFDIDNADISISISSVQQLVSKLQELGVSAPYIWLSGKKGFHIVIPAKVFSSAKKKIYLPYIYGLMAEKLDVIGLDHAVYSGGKGRMWRQPNVLREDNSKFKVAVSVDEVFTLTAESYAAFCSQPRPAIKQVRDAPSADLTEMFVECSRDVLEAMENRDQYIFTSDERLEEIDHEAEPPTCLTRLLDGDHAKANANFNRAAMNLAGYVKVSGVDSELADRWIERLCSHNNFNSATYTNPESRKRHVEQHLRRAQYDPNMGFIPSYFFSTIKPCGGCILCDGTLTGRMKSEEENISGNPIIVNDNRYLVRRGESDRPITTFVIEPTAYSVVADDDMSLQLRDSISVNIVYNQYGERQTTPCEFNEAVWNSSSNFKKALEGVGNAVWFGSDNDLAMLKHYIFSRQLDMSEIAKTSRVGLRVHQTPHGKVLVYVDGSGSLNSVGQKETHKIVQNIEAMPRAFSQDDFNPDNPEHMNVIRSLFTMNADYKMALAIGWFMAAHLKPHFESVANQFPLLMLWGNTGSGKTKTGSILGYLHAIDYEGRDNIATLGGTTPWAAAEHVAGSTSTPRLLDEFNRPKLEKSGKYSKISEMLKSAWGSQPHMRGTINGTKGGAEVTSLYMSGPVCVMAEQQPDEPPIQQRSIQINLNRTDRTGSEISFKTVYTKRNIISRLAKVFVQQAVKTPIKFVNDRMEFWYDLIPDETLLDSRPHYSYRATLVGLDFMKMACQNAGIDLDFEIENAQKAIVNYLKNNVAEIGREKNFSVCDRVLETMAIMAAESDGKEGTAMAIESGRHYLLSGDHLYVDIALVFNLVLRYSHSIRQPLEISSVQMFKKLVEDESYFVGYEDVPFSPRKAMRLNIHELNKKGIDHSLFLLAGS